MAPLISTIMMNRLCGTKDSRDARKGVFPRFSSKVINCASEWRFAPK